MMSPIQRSVAAPIPAPNGGVQISAVQVGEFAALVDVAAQETGGACGGAQPSAGDEIAEIDDLDIGAVDIGALTAAIQIAAPIPIGGIIAPQNAQYFGADDTDANVQNVISDTQLIPDMISAIDAASIAPVAPNVAAPILAQQSPLPRAAIDAGQLPLVWTKSPPLVPIEFAITAEKSPAPDAPQHRAGGGAPGLDGLQTGGESSVGTVLAADLDSDLGEVKVTKIVTTLPPNAAPSLVQVVLQAQMDAGEVDSAASEPAVVSHPAASGAAAAVPPGDVTAPQNDVVFDAQALGAAAKEFKWRARAVVDSPKTAPKDAAKYAAKDGAKDGPQRGVDISGPANQGAGGPQDGDFAAQGAGSFDPVNAAPTNAHLAAQTGLDALKGAANTSAVPNTAAPNTAAPSPAPAPAHLNAQILPHAQAAQNGPVEIVLNPAELGHLRFEIRPKGDQVQVILSAERPETLDMLRRNGEQLVQELRGAGFSGASISYGQWGGQWGQNAAQSGQAPANFMPDMDDETVHIQHVAPITRPPAHDPARSLNLRF